jgi:hypothetical protein
MREIIVEDAAWPGFPGEAEVQRRAAAGVYDQERDDAFAGRPDWSEITEMYQDAERGMPRFYNYEEEILKPIEDGSRQGLLGRARQAMGRAADTLRDASVSALVTAQTTTERTVQFFGDEERGARRQVGGTVLGALAVGTLAYLEVKGISVGQALPAPKPHHHEHAREVVRLHNGENPWSVTRDQLKAHGVEHPSPARVAADDSRLIKLNHIGLKQSLKLHVGDKLKLLKRW